MLNSLLCSDQCDQIWQNFTPLSKSLQAYSKFLTVYLLFGKILSLLWQVYDILGLILIVANG